MYSTSCWEGVGTQKPALWVPGAGIDPKRR